MAISWAPAVWSIRQGSHIDWQGEFFLGNVACLFFGRKAILFIIPQPRVANCMFLGILINRQGEVFWGKVPRLTDHYVSAFF